MKTVSSVCVVCCKETYLGAWRAWRGWLDYISMRANVNFFFLIDLFKSEISRRIDKIR